MMQADPEEATNNYYDTHALEWAQAHGDSDDTFWRQQMDVFHELLPTGNVLEIGSGTGRDAKALLKLGYTYTGTDISKGLLQLAQNRNPQAHFIRQSVYELSLNTRFEGFWTLPHYYTFLKNESMKRYSA